MVGGGYWGKNHIRTLNDLGILGGIVESNGELLGRFQEQYPNIKTYNNLDDALYNEMFSGYTIATSAETHYSIAKKNY